MYEFIDGHFIGRDPEGHMTFFNSRNGIGYQILTLSRDWRDIDETTGEIRVYIRAVFNESTGYTLYGFQNPIDRRAFDVIRRAQGVGGKLAMAVLSQLTVGDLAAATVDTFKSVKGVGPKVASKIIPELSSLQDLVASDISGREDVGAKDQAVLALVSLGFGRSDALRAVAAASQAHPDADQTTLLRTATGLLYR